MTLRCRFSSDELKRIGCRMHAARILTGLKLEEFASNQNISPASIKNWELGRVLPKQENILELIKAFKNCGVSTSLEWLLFGDSSLPYYSTNVEIFNNDLGVTNLLHQQISLFKRAQILKGLMPVIAKVNNNKMAPLYLAGDIIGGVSMEKDDICQEIPDQCKASLWLVKLADQDFHPFFVNAKNDDFYVNTMNTDEIKLCKHAQMAKIAWHCSQSV